MRAAGCQNAAPLGDASSTGGAAKPYLSQERERFEAALRQAHGNITQAAAALGISKGYAMVLMKRFDLSEWARQLRANDGVSATGRPRNARRSCAID